jgi:hypothetical protein
MAFDRRDFVRLGSMGAAGIAASACWPFDKEKPLRVVIRGLSFVDRHANSIDVHLLDAGNVNMMLHEAVLSVKASDRDTATTAPIAGTDPWDPSRIVFNLAGKIVMLDSGIGSAPDLGFDDDPIGEDLPSDDDDHWRSTKFGARLKTLCQMSQLTIDPAKVTARVTLEHGRLRAMRPRQMDGTESLGTHVKWKFSDASGNKIVKQAMTNAFLCTVPTKGSTAKFTLGAQTIVIKLPAEVWLRNLPKFGIPDICQDLSSACADHLAGYYSLVGCSNAPILSTEVVGGLTPGIEPNYCPPGI